MRNSNLQKRLDVVCRKSDHGDVLEGAESEDVAGGLHVDDLHGDVRGVPLQDLPQPAVQVVRVGGHAALGGGGAGPAVLKVVGVEDIQTNTYLRQNIDTKLVINH